MAFFRKILLFTSFCCFFSCNEAALPTIHIHTTAKLNFEEKKPISIKYKDSHIETNLIAKAKHRGGWSAQFEKRSYTIKLNDPFPLASLPPNDDWILNANYIDKTFLRHKFCYDLFRKMNPQNKAARCKYVELNLNNSYRGLYVLMEKITASMLDVDKNDPMAMVFKEPPIFKEKKPARMPTVEDYYEQKYPKRAKRDNTKYIEEFMDFLYTSKDEDFLKNVSTWIDLNSVIDWHLLLLLSNNRDGILKNFYLYKINGKTPFRISPWDYDHSFGRDGDNELNLDKIINPKRSILLKRLLEIKGCKYSTFLKKRWTSLRTSGVYSYDAFEAMLDADEAVFYPFLKKNAALWPNDGVGYYDANDYDTEIKIMKEFMKKRIELLDKHFSRM